MTSPWGRSRRLTGVAAWALAVAFVLTTLPSAPFPADAAPALARWAFYVSYDPRALASLRTHAGDLDVVIPDYYSVDTGGHLLGGDDPTVDAVVRGAQRRLIPLVQNHDRYAAFDPVLNDPAVRARTIDAIASMVSANDYDGICLDLEGLSPSDRDSLTRFASALADRLHAMHRVLVVAVAAQTTLTPNDWAAAYDYHALGAVADNVIVMAYAFNDATSAKPSSIAPADWVQRSTAFATSQMPPSKVILGVGFWGYDWNITTGGKAVARSYADTIDVGARYGGAFGYSVASQSAWLRYKASGASHEVWFEDSRSVRAKLAIARTYQLAGVAGWRLGQEDPSIWAVLRPAPAGAPDYAVPGGHFFTQTGDGSGDGFVVEDDDQARDWTEFQRLGGVTTLGYPISQRYVGPDGFVYQAFQRAVLQWRPELGHADLANTFDALTAAGQDTYLQTLGIPLPVADDGSGGDWSRARAIRLGWLTNPAIAARFRANPNPQTFPTWSVDRSIELYGLPASPPVTSGPFVVQRFQRVSLQLWTEDVPGMPAKGSVVGILGGELLKQNGLIPADAIVPVTP